MTRGRDPARMAYVREDFFRIGAPRSFDVGIDWGLIKHYGDPRTQSKIALLRSLLGPKGMQISSCTKDRLADRLFCRTLPEALNFGYRKLMTLRELSAHVERSGCRVEPRQRLPAHDIAVYRFS